MNTENEKLAFPLPGDNGKDPVIGLSRSSWLRLEESGAVKLIRINPSGGRTGRVLIPMSEAKKLLKTNAKKLENTGAWSTKQRRAGWDQK